MARIAYIRVSTEDQNTDRQDAMFEGYDKIFREKISGKNTDRPELKKLMEYVREGDTVTVESFSRFARNTKDLLELTEQLNAKGVEFISLKEKIDTTTPAGKFMFTVFAALEQFEREQILERQREGIREAKKKGVYKGRKPIAFNEERMKYEVHLVREGIQTHAEAMQHMDLKPNTYYRRVKELGI